jgi:hypothetical protein
MKWLAVALAVTPMLAQQVEEPRAKAADYPAHAALDNLALGADFLVHTFAGRGKTFLIEDYLVVEVAVYPAQGSRPMIAQSHFVLRINGKNQLLPQPPQFAAASLKYPDWTQKPTVVAGAGVGDSGVIIGRQPRVQRFPNDPRPSQERLPMPRAPEPADRSGIEKEEEASPAEVCVEQALPEGPAAGPIRGYLYFPHKGKVKSIKKLELLYSAEGRQATLTLRQ